MCVAVMAGETGVRSVFECGDSDTAIAAASRPVSSGRVIPGDPKL